MFRQDIKNVAYICAQLGVRKAVIAPGSRSTPLTLAFTAQSEISCYPVTDERSAGFFALGMAQYSGEPVVLICTSGSAVLNFAPAVVEAYYQHLPLIVITADRPLQWIDQSEGQTIRQQNIYANYVKASFQLPSDNAGTLSEQSRTSSSVSTSTSGSADFNVISTQHHCSTDFSDRLVSQAVDLAKQFPRGPVHLNVPLEEPLYVEMPVSDVLPRVIRTLPVDTLPAAETAEQFVQQWQSASKRMIVAGTGGGDTQLNEMLNTLARETDTLVVAENLSNLSGPSIISTPDVFFATLTEEEKRLLQPDLLITIGHSVVSKQLKQYLRTFKPRAHWQVQTELPYADTYNTLEVVVPVKATQLLKLVLPVNSTDASVPIRLPLTDAIQLSEADIYRMLIQSVNLRAASKAEAYFKSLTFCDTVVVRELLSQVPANWVVQLANSTPVRLSQLVATRHDLQYFGNRGTSGIEGSVSAAAGSALASGRQTLLISGDLSFLYDSNGMWNANFPSNLKIVVLNNGGANIFSMIGDQSVIERCQPFFDAEHQVNLQALTSAFGIQFQQCASHGELQAGIERLLSSDGAAVLEVTTFRDQNVKSYKELFKYLR